MFLYVIFIHFEIWRFVANFAPEPLRLWPHFQAGQIYESQTCVIDSGVRLAH